MIVENDEDLDDEDRLSRFSLAKVVKKEYVKRFEKWPFLSGN